MRPSHASTGRAARLVARLGQAQHRTSALLLASTGASAALGLLFWTVATRVAHLPEREVGIGAAVVALATIAALLGKGGFDIALLRAIPNVTKASGARLLRLAIVAGAVLAATVSLAFAAAAIAFGWMPELDAAAWTLLPVLAALLATTWLQDASFLARGHPSSVLARNVALGSARVVAIVPLALLAWPSPVAAGWAIGIAVSAALGLALALRPAAVPPPSLDALPEVALRRDFLHSAGRNVAGSAAEFLPGLLLPPLVLALDGPTAAAYFGIAWTAFSVALLASFAVGRSALAHLVHRDRSERHERAATIRRALAQQAILVVPGVVLGAFLAGPALGLFGAAYAANGGPILALLCLSLPFVAPIAVHLAVLRADERRLDLLLLPATLLVLLAVLVPTLAAVAGPRGAALAWVLANVPVGAWSAWRLLAESREVSPPAPTRAVAGRPDLE